MLPAWLSKMSEGNSELACRQFVAWVDFRRDEKGGESHKAGVFLPSSEEAPCPAK
jgi:hypothetical protein